MTVPIISQFENLSSFVRACNKFKWKTKEWSSQLLRGSQCSFMESLEFIKNDLSRLSIRIQKNSKLTCITVTFCKAVIASDSEERQENPLRKAVKNPLTKPKWNACRLCPFWIGFGDSWVSRIRFPNENTVVEHSKEKGFRASKTVKFLKSPVVRVEMSMFICPVLQFKIKQTKNVPATTKR